MKIPDLPGANVEKHLGIHIINSRLHRMIYRFVEEERHEVSRIYIGIIINDTVPGRYIQIFKRSECKHIGGNELPVIFLTVIRTITVCNQVGPGAVDYHRIEPPVKIIEIEPLNRIQMKPQLDERGIIPTEYV